MSPRRFWGAPALLAGLLAALLVMMAFASVAAATNFQRPLKEVFGSVEQPTFGKAEVIGVDRATGDVLIADRISGTVSRYHADGTQAPFAALGSNVIDGRLGEGGKPCAEEPASCDETPQGEISLEKMQIAVDETSGPTDGNIYVTQNHVGPRYNLVDIFSAEGEYLGHITASSGGTLRSATGIGVDPDGVVYAAGKWRLGTVETPGVTKCVPSGTFPTNIDCAEYFRMPEADLPEDEKYTGNTGQLALGAGPSAGSMFVAVTTFNSSVWNLVKMDVETGIGGRFIKGYGDPDPTSGVVAVDPTNGNPIIRDEKQELLEFDGSDESAAEPLSRVFAEGAGGEKVYSFALNGSGNVDLVSGTDHAHTYGQSAVVPTVIAEEAEEILTTSATLTGTVNAEGIEVSECFFEWGPSTAYGNTAPCVGAVPSDEEGHAVKATISGLTPNGAVYHYRLAARNDNGLERSADQTLATAHTVVTEAATVTGTETATLNGTVRPEGHAYTECVFEYGIASHPGYEASESCDPEAPLIPVDSNPHSVRAEIAGLQKGTVYRFRLKATNSEGTQIGEEVTFRTFGAPTIEVLRASGATQSSATIEAEINPNGIDASYLFEWGPTEHYGNVIPVSAESVGHGTVPVRVSANLSGLVPASSYHYRVVASNSDGETAQSEDQVLETLNTCGFAEGRCLEMASPREPGPAAQVGRFLGGLEMHYQAAEQEGALAYVMEAGLPEATRGTEVLYRGARGPSGWSAEQLSPPITRLNEQSGATANSSTYLGLAPDLECGVVASLQPLTADPAARLILEGGGGNLYRRNPDRTYTLITEVAPEEVKATSSTVGGEYHLLGMSADCSRVFFSTLHRYPGVPGAGSSRLYEWTAAEGLKNVGSIPKGGGKEEVAAATAGGNEDLYNAVSEDGSRIFFSATRAVGAVTGETAKMGVFVRENGESRDVSASETGEPDTGATYQGATPDGSKVYFTANAGLTAVSSPEGTDLYQYDLGSEKLTDLSVVEAGAAEAGGVIATGRGALVGVADNGSHVYFVARGQLVPGQGRTLAQNTTAGTLSLYDYDLDAEAVRYVGAIGDSRGDVERATTVVTGKLTSRVSPDGRYLLFESLVNVTGYEGGGAPEAYLYDADEPEGSAVVCISCRQDGTASASSPSQPLLASGGLYEPQSLVVRGGEPIMVFASRDVLAPGGSENRWNLYQWAHGQVFLVSTETADDKLATEPSASLLFTGASANGTDLYFFDSAPHTWEDPEGRPAAWDLRVGGGFPEPPPPRQGCEPGSEGSCQGPAETAPTAPDAGSRTFNGPGNVKKKHKHHKKKHKHHKKKHKHHKKKHKKHGKKGEENRNKRANDNRRAGR